MPVRPSLVTALAVLALAGCGSAARPAVAGGDRAHSAFLSFSRCMRSHGIASFPDPSPGGGGIHLETASGLDPQSPSFQAGKRACHGLLPGGGPPASVPESVKLQALWLARCMRAHGATNFPDPTVRGGGRIREPLSDYGVDVQSPAFRSAAKACGGGGF